MDLSFLVKPAAGPTPKSLEEAVKYYRERAEFWQEQYLREVICRSRQIVAAQADLQMVRASVARAEEHLSYLKAMKILDQKVDADDTAYAPWLPPKPSSTRR